VGFSKEVVMIIKRFKNKYSVEDGFKVLLENVSFDEAREFLAKQGKKDCEGDLYKHSNTLNNEKIIEPWFVGNYEVCLNRGPFRKI
jgi:hypothetical protein